jgi:hypothetical protein
VVGASEGDLLRSLFVIAASLVPSQFTMYATSSCATSSTKRRVWMSDVFDPRRRLYMCALFHPCPDPDEGLASPLCGRQLDMRTRVSHHAI